MMKYKIRVEYKSPNYNLKIYFKSKEARCDVLNRKYFFFYFKCVVSQNERPIHMKKTHINAFE